MRVPRICGALIGLLALLSTFMAFMARIEGDGDLDYLVDADMVVGGFCLAQLVLLIAPDLRGPVQRDTSV